MNQRNYVNHVFVTPDTLINAKYRDSPDIVHESYISQWFSSAWLTGALILTLYWCTHFSILVRLFIHVPDDSQSQCLVVFPWGLSATKWMDDDKDLPIKLLFYCGRTLVCFSRHTVNMNTHMLPPESSAKKQQKNIHTLELFYIFYILYLF